MYVCTGVTGDALPADVAAFRSHGLDEVLTKPINRRQLLGALVQYGATLDEF